MRAVWWRADVQSLHRYIDRVSTVYVERCHVDRAENAVVLVNRARTVRVPAAMVAAVLLGPGTRVTHGAMNLLGDSGTAVCWVGEHGVRLYAAGHGMARSARLLTRQAALVSNRQSRLRVAREMYSRRFPGEDVATLTMQQLRGREGTRVRRLYRENSERTGVPWARREYQAGNAFARGDSVNRLISAGNACLYGLCHAAVAAVGASPGLGFVHTGSTQSFVLDVADLYKGEYTIPLAFDLTSRGRTEERDIRLAFRDRLVDGQLLHRIMRDILVLLGGESSEDVSTEEGTLLWDEREGAVSGGVNWSSEDAFGGHAVISGPELPPETPLDGPPGHLRLEPGGGE